MEQALKLGCTMITLDCSEHILNGVDGMTAGEVRAACALSDEMKARYLGRGFGIAGHKP